MLFFDWAMEPWTGGGLLGGLAEFSVDATVDVGAVWDEVFSLVG